MTQKGKNVIIRMLFQKEERKIYEESEKIITLQDSTIKILNKLILNKDYMLRVADTTITDLNKELLFAEK